MEIGKEPRVTVSVCNLRPDSRGSVTLRSANPLPVTGTVAVALTVARDGRLVDAAIVTSSGNQAFDGAALKAIRAAGRFPRGPADLDGAHRFSFNLRFIP